MPLSIVASLVAAGLGEKNLRGTLDINNAGRDYHKAKNLPTNTDKRRRFDPVGMSYGEIRRCLMAACRWKTDSRPQTRLRSLFSVA
jgi:hypothetical protein